MGLQIPGAGDPEFLSLPQLEDLKNELEKRQAKKTPEISPRDSPARGQEEKNQQPVREFSCFGGKSEGIIGALLVLVWSGELKAPRG